MWKRLAKWVVQHGLDELLKEIARREAGAQPQTSIPPAVRSLLSQAQKRPPASG